MVHCQNQHIYVTPKDRDPRRKESSIYILLRRHRVLTVDYVLLNRRQLIAHNKINLGQTIVCPCQTRLSN